MRVSDPLRADVVSRANKRCEYCQYPEDHSPSSFHVEHIVPSSADGPTELKNLALACSHCNSHKAARQIGTDLQTGTDVRLFNPRIDDWTDHFRLNRKTGGIEGHTPKGRVTVEIVQMNATQPIGARQFLIEFGVL